MRATCSITPTPAGTNSSDRCFSSSTQVGRSAATALTVRALLREDDEQKR